MLLFAEDILTWKDVLTAIIAAFMAYIAYRTERLRQTQNSISTAVEKTNTTLDGQTTHTLKALLTTATVAATATKSLAELPRASPESHIVANDAARTLLAAEQGLEEHKAMVAETKKSEAK